MAPVRAESLYRCRCLRRSLCLIGLGAFFLIRLSLSSDWGLLQVWNCLRCLGRMGRRYFPFSGAHRRETWASDWCLLIRGRPAWDRDSKVPVPPCPGLCLRYWISYSLLHMLSVVSIRRISVARPPTWPNRPRCSLSISVSLHLGSHWASIVRTGLDAQSKPGDLIPE